MERPIMFSGPMVRAILEGQKTQTRRVVDLTRLRARLPYAVSSDFADLLPDTAVRAEPASYRAAMNPHGAVSIDVKGASLGVKPGEFDFLCPYAVGTTRLVNGRWHLEPHGSQRLWVRETFILEWPEADRPEDEKEFQRWVNIHYRATDPKPALVDAAADWDSEKLMGWIPPLAMPRWASRITLEVTKVRVERLRDITEVDALAEGVEPEMVPHYSARAVLRGHDPSRRNGFLTLWDSINGKRAPWSSNPWVWVVEFKRLETAERAA